ncbi:MAG: amidohydrolase family protein [Spirochaetia bacterium]|nr:amidohydrolase family protein [Spirochaetia bacterium]
MKRKILIWILGISYVFLFLWAFAPIRQTIKLSVLSMFGAARSKFSSVPEDIYLSSFQPTPELVPVSVTEPARPKFDVIEFHGHLFADRFGGPPEDLAAQMQKGGIKYFIDLALFTSTLKEYQKLVEKTHQDNVIHFVGFNWKHLREAKTDDFGVGMAKDLEEIAKAGVRGVKLWKNFGLIEKTPDGKLLAMDDPRLDPVWDVCAKYKLLVAIHTADPPAFFRPVNQFNERFDELGRRPEWSFDSPDLPKLDEILAQRERLFKRRKDVTFVALHFGELAHNLKRAASLLDTNPNVSLDIAQRIDELGRQPFAAREFLIKYQDRILFGTDGLPDYKKIKIYWRFLETSDEYFDYYPAGGNRKGVWKIYGVHLPDPVLKKIYYTNAARLLRLK